MIHANSNTRKILEYVQANPGVTRGQIITALSLGIKPAVVSNLLGRLQKMNALENRGGRAQHSRWYPIEMPTNPVYDKLAKSLLDELKTVHHANREAYLSKRLEEIFRYN